MPRKPRALILAPTRELVGQIHAALKPMADAAGLSTVVIYGGVGQGPQTTALKKGVDIVIACPGRLEDLMGQGYADLSAIEITILDEADHMADLGFLPGVRRIMDKTPRNGQRLLFSATLDKAIDVLVKRFLTNPVTHEADSAQSPVSTMSHHVLHVARDQRVPVLVDLTSAPGRTVVFTRTKHGAKALARQLNKSGVPVGRPARQPQPERAHAQHGDVPLRQGHDAGRDRHRRARHPRRRRGARDPRRPADRAQGLPAPLRSYGACRRRGHRHHPDDRRPGPRRARPDPSRRHQADHHQGPRLRPPDAGRSSPPASAARPGGLVVEVPTSGGGGGRSNGANAQRKRARSTGQTNGQSRRGNPTGGSSRLARGWPARTGGGRRPASSLRRRQVSGGGQGGGSARPGRTRAQHLGWRRTRVHSSSSFSAGADRALIVPL